MSEFFSQVKEYLDHEQVRAIIKAAIILIAGYFGSRVIRQRLHHDALQAQQQLILRRLGSAVLLVLSVTWALSVLGMDLGVVLGTAGILTVAVGFAAQTSVSNLISGVFLMIERPFSVGDIILVADTTGEVLSIDSMSVKLRTFDNILVRIPNEAMLKANVSNFSYFPIRRYDMKVGVSYGEDIARVRDILIQVAYHNPLCLVEPKPLIIFLAYGDSALELQFSIWAARTHYLDMRNSMHEEVKRAFDEHGIEIPFPQRTVHMVAAPDAAPGKVGAVDAPAGERYRENR